MLNSLTVEQKYKIALDMLCAKIPTSEVCAKHGISASCAYYIANRAREVLRAEIGRSVRQSKRRTEHLVKRVEELEQLVGDQTLAIRILKNKLRQPTRRSSTRTKIFATPVPDGGSEMDLPSS